MATQTLEMPWGRGMLALRLPGSWTLAGIHEPAAHVPAQRVPGAAGSIARALTEVRPVLLPFRLPLVLLNTAPPGLSPGPEFLRLQAHCWSKR